MGDHPILLLEHMLWHDGYHHGAKNSDSDFPNLQKKLPLQGCSDKLR